MFACRDTAPTATPLFTPGAAERHVASEAPLADGIQEQIRALFPRELRNSALHKWREIQEAADEARAGGRKHGDDDDRDDDDRDGDERGERPRLSKAQRRLVHFVDWIQRRTSRLTPTPPETAEHAAARLVLAMSLYVYEGPLATPPALSAETDAVLAIVLPKRPAVVQTPSKRAGVSFPSGAVAVPTLVVVSQVTTRYPDNCSGPLQTTLCQYPQFYRFDVFPDVKLLRSATVAVCHVNAGSLRAPLVDHARFRLAHAKPADPANYVPGGTVVEGIEILPLVVTEGLVTCDGTSYETASATRNASPLDVAVRRVAGSIQRALTPREAHAIDLGGGGLVDIFSAFGIVDPLSAPDLAATKGPGDTPPLALSGDVVSLGPWTIENLGTASAGAFSSAIVLATDSGLTTGAVQLASLGDPTSLVARAEIAGAARSVVIPADLAPGHYFIGIRADVTGTVAEIDESNNAVSVRIEVRTPINPEGAIAVADRHACALDAFGTAYCWGDNTNGQLGNGTTVASAVPVAVAAPAGGPVLQFTQISVGLDAACGITVDRAAYCWGRNQGGQLGNGSTINSPIPVKVSGELDFASIGTSIRHTCALTTKGRRVLLGIDHPRKPGHRGYRAVQRAACRHRRVDVPRAFRGTVRRLRPNGGRHGLLLGTE